MFRLQPLKRNRRIIGQLVTRECERGCILGIVTALPALQDRFIRSDVSAEVKQARRDIILLEEICVCDNDVAHLAIERHEDGGDPEAPRSSLVVSRGRLSPPVAAA